jgi:hypothetical protein
VRHSVRLLALVLCGSAFAAGPAELRRTADEVDRVLAERKRAAEQLQERRREMDQLEAKLAKAQTDLPNSKDVSKGPRVVRLDGGTLAREGSKCPAADIEGVATRAPWRRVALPTMPEEQPDASTEEKNLRRHIESTMMEISMLDRIIGELANIEKRRLQIQFELCLLEELKTR